MQSRSDKLVSRGRGSLCFIAACCSNIGGTFLGEEEVTCINFIAQALPLLCLLYFLTKSDYVIFIFCAYIFSHLEIFIFIIAKTKKQMHMDRNRSSRVNSNLNKLSKHKAKEQSEFRVHFYLMNIYCGKDIPVDIFLDSVASKISRIVKVSIVQICNSIDQFHVDLTVGLQNDSQALKFLSFGSKISLPCQSGEMKQYSPVISNVFKSYMSKYRIAQTNDVSANKGITTQKRQDDELSVFMNTKKISEMHPNESPYSNQFRRQSQLMRKQSEKSQYPSQIVYHRQSSDPYKGTEQFRSDLNRSRSNEVNKSITYNKHVSQVYILWLFGIPLECRQKDVDQMLYERGFRLRYTHQICLGIENIDKNRHREWKFKEDMEYMQVQLVDTVSSEYIETLDLFIDRCPVMVIPRRSDYQYVNQELTKLQVEVNFDKDPDQVELIRFADKCGGVISMIKDEFNGPKKYLVAFNNLRRANVFTEIEKVMKNCRAGKPKYPLRIGRLEKNFTFRHMADNMNVEENNQAEESSNSY